MLRTSKMCVGAAYDPDPAGFFAHCRAGFVSGACQERGRALFSSPTSRIAPALRAGSEPFFPTYRRSRAQCPRRALGRRNCASKQRSGSSRYISYPSAAVSTTRSASRVCRSRWEAREALERGVRRRVAATDGRSGRKTEIFSAADRRKRDLLSAAHMGRRYCTEDRTWVACGPR